MTTATTAIVHDKRIKCKKDKYAVKLRVTHERVQKYYPLGRRLTDKEWENTMDPETRKEYKANRLYFGQIEKKAIDIIKDLEVFSFPAFEKKFNGTAAPKKDVLYLLDEYIKKLTSEERLTTAESYTSSKKSFEKFRDHCKK